MKNAPHQIAAESALDSANSTTPDTSNHSKEAFLAAAKIVHDAMLAEAREAMADAEEMFADAEEFQELIETIRGSTALPFHILRVEKDGEK